MPYAYGDSIHPAGDYIPILRIVNVGLDHMDFDFLLTELIRYIDNFNYLW